MAEKSNKEDGGARTGRRLKSEGPSFPREEVDRLLVHGEVRELEDGGGEYVHYPTYRELGERYGVAHSVIAKYATQHNCLNRRKQTKKRVRDISDDKLAELRAEALAVKRDDIVRAIDRFLVDFETALREGRVRCDNPSDYNTIVRLRAFVLGDSDSRAELIVGLTPEELARRHKEYQQAMGDSTPEVRGEVIPLPAPARGDRDEDDERDSDEEAGV